ncbi:hypothetical protein C1H46_027664 [Malus baccata]|uniref:Uncharacterized protein n=1 Tax=Malus baccata TaxID=106549 RepID=A0A540LJZ2_MALBA|nr:hypothetical protein C1H46_027664 [Malus baccata]
MNDSYLLLELEQWYLPEPEADPVPGNSPESVERGDIALDIRDDASSVESIPRRSVNAIPIGVGLWSSLVISSIITLINIPSYLVVIFENETKVHKYLLATAKIK